MGGRVPLVEGGGLLDVPEQGHQEVLAEDVEAVHDGVGNVSPVTSEGLPLVRGPLGLLQVVHGLS